MGNNANIGTVTAKVTADTAEFDGKMAKSADVATATSRAIEKAAQRQADAQAFAAKFAGDAVDAQTLRIVEARKREAAAGADLRTAQKLARAGYGDEAEGANLVAAALQRLTQAKLEVAAASEVEERTSVSNTNAASASIRLVEGGMTNNIRAVERFLGSLPGVGAALRTIFPVVGALAFAGLVVEIGAKVYEYGQQGARAGKEIKDAFTVMEDASRQTSVDLDIANDKLDIQIAKLEKTPANLLRLALDDDRKAALDLASGIDKASRSIDELLKKNGVSFAQRLGGAFFGHNIATTTDTKDVIDSAFAGVNQADDQATANLYNAKPGQDKEVAAANRKLTMDAVQNALNLIDARLKSLHQASSDEAVRNAAAEASGLHGDTPTDYSANFSALSGTRTILQAKAHDLRAQYAKSDKEAQQKTLEDNKEQAAEAASAAKEAAAARLQAMELELSKEQRNGKMSVKATYDYWAERIGAFTAGSQQYREIYDKQTSLALDGAQQAADNIRKFQEDRASMPTSTSIQSVISHVSTLQRRDRLSDASTQVGDMVDSNQLAIVDAQNKAREREAEIMSAAGKSMTQYAAAVALAEAHTKEFEATQQALKAIVADRELAAGLNPTKENNRALADAQSQVAISTSHRFIQVRSDSEAMNGPQGSGLVGATDALDQFVRASRDAATMMRDLVNNTLNGLNQQIVAGVTGQHTNFRQFGLGVTRNVAGAALEKGEGAIFGMLGFGGGGKLGTKGNPMHTISEDAKSAVSGISSAATGLLSKATGGGVAGFFGHLLSSFLPHFADGGPISADTWAMVGERGPELFHSGGGGSIVPNHKLSDMSSGNMQSISYSIDARGTDPVQTEMRVRSAIVAAHQSSVKQSVKQVQQQSARKPSRSR
jgi:lambda family phage tail tape measure protein